MIFNNLGQMQYDIARMIAAAIVFVLSVSLFKCRDELLPRLIVWANLL